MKSDFWRLDRRDSRSPTFIHIREAQVKEEEQISGNFNVT